jgi:hypothetical protein
MVKYGKLPIISETPDPTLKARVRRAVLDVDAKLCKLHAAGLIPPETWTSVDEIARHLKGDAAPLDLAPPDPTPSAAASTPTPKPPPTGPSPARSAPCANFFHSTARYQPR